jgi:hypothetical protein
MNLKQNDLIEAYLKGELSGADKAAFEAQLEQDPLFKSEIDLQGDIISSLKTYRKNQLKARLNNIDVSSATLISASAAKIVASLVIAAFIGYLGYYFYPSDTLEDKEDTRIVQQEVFEEDQNVNSAAAEQKEEEKATESTQIIETEVAQPKAITKNTVTKKKEAKEHVVSPNVIDSFDESTGIDKEDKDAIVEVAPSMTSDRITNIEIAHEESKAKELKYKYLNKKLYLFGDFSASPYELLELNSYQGKKLFLFHGDKYYELSEKQKAVAPLVPIADSLVIQELDTLRQNKTN